MATTTEVESFYLGDEKVGVLVRQCSLNNIRTTLSFKIGDGPAVYLFQETRFPTDVFSWIEYTYFDLLEGVRIEERSADELLQLAPRNNPIPSYAAHLLLKDFLATNEPRRDFSQFEEGASSTVVSAAFVRHGMEEIETLNGSHEALKVVLEVDGRAGNIFWCVDTLVVKSDWQGATSYANSDVALALENLDDDVLRHLEPVLSEFNG